MYVSMYWLIYKKQKTKNNKMGFNVSGLVINENYENRMEDLQAALGWNLQKGETISFETASSNWKDERLCDVYFSEKGTLLFISMERCAQPLGIKNTNTLTFALSETSMVFNRSYCENGIVKRSIMEMEGDRMSARGEQLPVEEISEDTSEIIWNQLAVVLGKRFWDIEFGEKAERYTFV